LDHVHVTAFPIVQFYCLVSDCCRRISTKIGFPQEMGLFIQEQNKPKTCFALLC